MNYAQKLAQLQSSLNEAKKLTPLDIQGRELFVCFYTHYATPRISVLVSGDNEPLALININISEDGDIKVSLTEEAKKYFKKALKGENDDCFCR